jgi:uncharacterized protein (TIGR03437 family)
MKSSNNQQRAGSEGLGGGALRLAALVFVFTGSVIAQSIPASISTIPQRYSDPVFDAAGNTYYLLGPSTAGAAQTQPGGGTCLGATNRGIPYSGPCPDAAVSKFDPSGNQVWGTLLGGPTADTGTALVIDTKGNVLLTGRTAGQFPTTPGAAIGSSTSAMAFAAKISSDGTRVLYSTYLPDSVAATSLIAVDAAGSAYVGGKTSTGQALVLKLSPDGSTIDYNVIVGGSGAVALTSIAVDLAGNAIVAGQTTSSDFPVTTDAFQQHLKGIQNCFLVRLDSAGNILSGTYFGGSGSDSASSIAVDGTGNIDLAGSTSSLDLPTTPGTNQPTAIVPPWNNTSPAGFVAQFAPDGISLNWASYVMSSDFPTGSNLDVGVSALAVDSAGDIYIDGRTGPGFPVTSSAPAICFQGTSNRTNGFLAHLNSNGALMNATYLGDSTGGDVFVNGVMPLPDGTVLIAWSDAVVVVSKVRFGSAGWTAPACLSNNVLNAATQAGTAGISPGELITLTGFGIGPDIGVAYQPDSKGNAPTQLAGVQVLFDGVPVPILYAQSRQVNAIAPVGLTANGIKHVMVTYNNQQFGPAVAQTIFGNPGIFRQQIGQSAQAVAINQDGTLNGSSNPAPRGSVVAVWGTGYGQTNPSCQSGGLNVAYAAPLSFGISALIVDVGSLTSVQYAGSAPTLPCGVVQINFQVPMNIAPGTFSFLPGIRLQNGTTSAQYQSAIGAIIAVK